MATSTERCSTPSRSRTWCPVATASKPERDRAVQQRRELDLLVAPQARVGGPAGARTRPGSRRPRPRVKPLAEIPDVERDPEQVGDPPGVEGVLDRCSSPGTRCAACPGAGQRHVHADHVMPGIDRQRRRHRRSPLRRSSRPARASAIPSRRRSARPSRSAGARGPARQPAGSAASTASTSAAVEVCPKENRSAPRAVRVDAHREQDMDWAGRPRRCRPSRWSTRSRWRPAASAASRPRSRGTEVGVAGQPRRPDAAR